MRTLTTNEVYVVGGGGDSSTPPPKTLPTITVTPSSQQILAAAGGSSTNQCSLGAFSSAAIDGAELGGGVAAVKNASPMATAIAMADGATGGLIYQDWHCLQQIGNEIHFITNRK